jgi:hypothetical protein
MGRSKGEREREREGERERGRVINPIKGHLGEVCTFDTQWHGVLGPFEP